MSRRLYEALYLIDATEHTARLKTPLAQIDARAKLVVLLTFLLTMLSLPTERLSNLMLFAIYPITMAAAAGIPVPAFSSALSYFDGYTSAVLPANLLQAQRDFFGAHTYERIDAPRGQFFHTDWTGHGGDTSASTYNA